MTDVMSIVGARPQFVKAAVVSRALRRIGIRETLIHTGQHYDAGMSAVFFEEMGIPEPDVNLGVGSGSHAYQTGEIMVRLEEQLMSRPNPDCVLVFGDTNSTLAAAVTARKLHIPVAHVEAGLRSFNQRMPEELNRIVTDRLSDWLFCPTETACENLQNEGITNGIHLTGDVMLDATLHFADRARKPAQDFPDRSYVVATVHRAENTDDPKRLGGIMTALGALQVPVLFPAHPRTMERLKGFALPDNIFLVQPLSYLEMLYVVKRALRVITDSGGLQKEALWLGTPCITLRDETEWIETLEGGWNVLAGADPDRITAAMRRDPGSPIPSIGRVDGNSASDRIASILLSN